MERNSSFVEDREYQVTIEDIPLTRTIGNNVLMIQEEVAVSIDVARDFFCAISIDQWVHI